MNLLRIVRRVGLLQRPAVGEEAVEILASERACGEAGGEVAEVGEGVEVESAAGGREGKENGGGVASRLAADEEPVVAFMRTSA